MNGSAALEFAKKYMKWLIIGGVVLVLAFALFVTKNGIVNTGNTKEVALNAQYQDNQNYLSDCIVRIRESAGIAKGQRDALDTIITDAVQGRYDAGSTAQVGKGAMFSAITEAYPDLSALSGTFDKVLIVVNGCRTDYRGKQTQLLSMLKDFDTWRIGSWTVRTFGGSDFPDDNLQAQIGGDITTGKAALIQMKTIVLVKDATGAYKTGTLTPEDPFANK
jgi:hypothetical protein